MMDYSKFRLRSFTLIRSQYNLPCGSHNELPMKYCTANRTDEDVMIYYYDICAIPWNRNPPHNTRCTVLRIDSKQTPPGYVRLVVDRNNMEDNPTYFRRPPVLNDIETGGPSTQVEKRLTHEGRALLPVNLRAVVDKVLAIYCPYWPVEAEEWRKRKRFHGWPNEKLIARITRGGCHFVSKLRTWSSCDDTEWRFSFSKAELLLIHSWTDFQKLVYHAIRVKKKRISEFCGGVANKGFQTYYFKTLMFWACEEFPAEFWREENLNKCVITLLRRFHECLQEKFCPSYFIPKCNIMSHLKNEGDFHKELQSVHTLISEVTIVPVDSESESGTEQPLDYEFLNSLYFSFPLFEELNGHRAQYLSECEWFLPEMKNLHAAIEAHLRLMSLDSVTQRQTTDDYVVCVENFNRTLLKRQEFESYERFNRDKSYLENWNRMFVRKVFRNSILIYRRKCPTEDPRYKMLTESFPSLLHSVTSAYRANFYFTAMKSYKEALIECQKCFEVFKKTIGFVHRIPLELTSHIPLLICNSLSHIFDEHLQVVLGFATLHRNVSFSNSRVIAMSHEVCLKMSTWDFLKYVQIQCEQKLPSTSKPTPCIFPSSLEFDRPYMSQLVDSVIFSTDILFAALRQSGTYQTPAKLLLIAQHFSSSFDQRNLKPELFRV